MILKWSRQVFIDSEINAVGNGQLSKINFPPSAFSVAPKEQMKLTLTSFEMRRNFYSINPSNNIIYWYDGVALTYTACVIAQGSYDSFIPTAPGGVSPPLTLGDAIINAILSVPALVGSTIAYSSQTRKYTITLPGGLPNGSKFVSFQVKQTPSPPPTNVSPAGYFNDSNEILGGFPTRDNFTEPVDLFSGSITPGLPVALSQVSPFVCALNTLEAIYIRTNLHSGNYQTYGFEKNLPNQQGLTPTQIFARIPLSRAYFDTQHEFISFEDPNDLFSMYLSQTQLSQVYFSITDDKGRLIEEVADGQSAAGNLSFKMSFKYDVLVDEVPPNDQPLQLKNLERQYPHLTMN